MARLTSLLLTVLACICFSLSQSPGQVDKSKGTLPANWNKLNLTEEQKQKILKVQNYYADQIAILEAQIKALKAEELAKMEQVLTDAQKARLRELLGKQSADKK